ncbi:MAG: hypothetical protein JWL95_2805 [Gemmatimonadetes bacterium]|nr:hypothetical protein [Gemmatimonadota bacterium]
MPITEPSHPATQRQLATIRKLWKQLDLDVEETFDPAYDMSFFAIDTEVSELQSLHFVHVPGLLSGHAVFGVRPAEKHRREVERFAQLFNAGTHEGTVVVRSGAPCTVMYRASINYSKVKNLDIKYVAGLFDHIIDAIPEVDLPLILIAQGKSAAAAIAQVLELPADAPIALPAKKANKAKKAHPASKPKRAAKRRSGATTTRVRPTSRQS